MMQLTPTPTLQAEHVADVCIVGAGAAGLLLATRIARTGKSVTLLEAGSHVIDPAHQDSLRSTVSGAPHHKGIHEGRARSVGGTTLLWGGQLLPFEASDFCVRSWVDGSGWPISRDSLEPYYKEVFGEVGLAEVLTEDAAVRASRSVPDIGNSRVESYYTRWIPEPNFAKLFASTLQETNLNLMSGTTVIDLNLDGSAVSAVKVKQDGRSAFWVHARIFIFAMGTIETIRFFLNVRESRPTPWSTNSLLGADFQDHVDVDVAKLLGAEKRIVNQNFANCFIRGLKYHPKLKLTHPTQQDLGVLGIGGTMHFPSASQATLSELRSTMKVVRRDHRVDASDLAKMARNAPLAMRQVYHYYFKGRSYVPADAIPVLRAHCEQPPRNRNTVRLSNDVDAYGMRRTSLHWEVGDQEVRTITAFAREVKNLLSERGIGMLDTTDSIFEQGLMNRMSDTNHQMSGMRMGCSSSDGLVDENLKLFGVDNAYICSAAVFPSSGFSNPTHTLLALALRLSSHLNGQM